MSHMDRYIKLMLRRFIIQSIYTIATIWVAILLIGLLIGCSSVRYVPVETIQHDSIYISKLERDSIHVHDSIYLEVKQQADTIIKTKYVQKVVYRDALRTDTMIVERVDTIRLPYPVERQLSKWEKIKLDFGGTIIGGIAIFALSAAAMWLLRRKRNNI